MKTEMQVTLGDEVYSLQLSLDRNEAKPITIYISPEASDEAAWETVFDLRIEEAITLRAALLGMIEAAQQPSTLEQAL